MRILVLFFRILFVVFLPIAAGVGFFFFLKQGFIDPVQPGSTETAIFIIEPASTFATVADELAQKGYVRYSLVPKFLAKLRKIDTRRIRAGEYELSKGMTPTQIITKIGMGEVLTHKVTVTEGMVLRDLARSVAAANLIPEPEFWKILHDPMLLKRWGIPNDSFEGYLYPETYLFTLPVKAEEIISTMIKEGEKVWPDDYTVQAEKLRMTRHEVLTLASIIEKESGDPAEQPKISAVFHNRLNRGMKLQADPTVIYGISNFNGNLTKEDLQEPTPYNTYVIEGLPKGPIGNPGRTAIYAALFPAQVPYLYFVSNGNGTHRFSVELKDHNKAVEQLVELGREQADEKPAPAPSREPELVAPKSKPLAGIRPTPRSPVITMGKK